MDSKILICTLCYQDFDLSDHLPRFFPICGHSFCTDCLKKIIADPNGVTCPLDKRKFASQKKSIEDFPKNFTVIDIIERKTKIELCQDHNEKMRYICYTDARKICENCIWKDGHQHHNIKPLKAVKVEALAQKKQVDAFLNELREYYENIDECLCENREMLLSTVKSKFNELRDAINLKEQRIIFELDCLFDLEKKRVKEVLGESGALRKDMGQKSSDLSNILTQGTLINNENFANDIQTQINKYKSMVTGKVIKEEITKVREWCESVSQPFNEKLNTQIKYWFELECPFNNPLESSTKIFTEDFIETFALRPVDSHLNSLKVNSSLKITQDGDYLSIKRPEAKIEYVENNLNITQLGNTKIINIDLDIDVSKEKDLQFFSYLWTKPKEPQDIGLFFFTEKNTKEIYDTLLVEPRDFASVHIDMFELKPAEENSIGQFLEKFLPKMKKLKRFSITMCKSKVTLKSFAAIKTLSTDLIEQFKFNSRKTERTDEEMSQVFLALPNIKSYVLNLRSTKITDETLRMFSKITLSSAQCLETLKLYLNQTKITDNGALLTLPYLKHLKTLNLWLDSTRITNRFMEPLARTIKSLSEGLEELSLGFDSTAITDEGLSQIFVELPKVTKLSLYLGNTKIADKSIEAFTQNTLPFFGPLNLLQLFLDTTLITDASFGPLLMELDNIQNLLLDIRSKGITDVSVGPFVIDRLPVMKDLKVLQIDVLDTVVSTDVKAKIKNMEESLKTKKEA